MLSKRNLLYSFLALVLSWSSIQGQVASNSATGLNYMTVQGAINAAVNNYTVYLYSDVLLGSTILVSGKTNFTLTRRTGHPSYPRIDKTGTTSVGIQVTNCSNVSFNEIVVGGFTSGLQLISTLPQRAISCRVEDCVFDGNSYGVEAVGTGVSALLVSSNRIFDGAIGFAAQRGTHGNRIVSNWITSNQYGVYLGWSSTPSSNNFIGENYFDTNNYNYVAISGSSGNLFATNTIVGINTAAGIYYDTGAISNTALSNHINGPSYGILVGVSGTCTNLRILGNHVLSNANRGFVANNATPTLLVAGNTFHSTNGIGILFDGGSTNGRIFSNVIYGQPVGIRMGDNDAVTNQTIAWNHIYSNSSLGILISNVSRNIYIQSNSIWTPSGTTGIKVTAGANLITVQSNYLGQQNYGLLVGDAATGASNCLFSENYFYSNVTSGASFVNSPTRNNSFVGNELANQLNWAVSIGTTSVNLFATNQMTAVGTGFNFNGGANNLIVCNSISSVNYGVRMVNTSSTNILVASNTIQTSGVGIHLFTGPNLNRLISNAISGASVGILLDGGNQNTNNLILSNDINGATICGIYLTNSHHNNWIFGNTVRNGSGNGIVLHSGPTNAQVYSNTITGHASGNGVWSYNSSNALIGYNHITGNRTGVLTDYLTQTPRIFLNNLYGNNAGNLSNLVGAAYNAPSNYYGSGNRAFSQKGISLSGPFISDPWLNGPIGVNGDFVIPPALTSIVASNGAPGTVNVHWGPLSGIADFSQYQIFRTRTSNAYSNLTDSDLVKTVTAAATTNWVDTLIGGGHYYYYVSVLDANGNESWYSPQGTVNYLSNEAPVANFFGPQSWATNLPASFQSTGTYGTDPVTNFRWVLGDGAVSNGATLTNVSHIYGGVTNTTVTLTVLNNRGQSNSFSQSISIFPYSVVGGRISGTTSNGVFLTLASAVTQMSTTSGSNGIFYMVASNDTYSLVPYKLGYLFTPSARSVTVASATTTNNDFTASDIYPVLTLKSNDSQNLQPGQKIVRDLPLYAVSLNADMLTTVNYSLTNVTMNGFETPRYHTNIFGIPHGTRAVLDTTRIEDGYYLLTATAVDKVFFRSHSSSMVLYFDNQLFKILDKGLEEKKAMVYDTVRHLNRPEIVEFFFYLTKDQPLRIDLYDKTGRFLKNFTTANFYYGHNRLVWNKTEMPAELPAGIYYAHFKTTITDEINKSVLLVFKRN